MASATNKLGVVLSILSVSFANFCVLQPTFINTTSNTEYYIANISAPLSYQNIKCNSSRSCHIVCAYPNICEQTYIECESSSCNIECTGIDSCTKISIKTFHSPNVQILCNNISSCSNSSLSIISNNSITNQAHITCSYLYSCASSIITSNTNTTINCGTIPSAYNACENIQIYIDSGIDDNIKTFLYCNNNHKQAKHACINGLLYVSGTGLLNQAYIHCGSVSNYEFGPCWNTQVYCNIDTFDCKVFCELNSQYACGGSSTLYCKGGEGITCNTTTINHFGFGNWTNQTMPWKQVPMSLTLTPAYCPTDTPTLYPTQLTVNPTQSPTDDIYGVVITVKFNTIFTNNDTIIIVTKLEQITNKLINSTIGRGCVEYISFNTTLNITALTTNIEEIIILCNETTQNDFITLIAHDNDGNTLKDDLITAINEDSVLSVDIDENDLIVDVSIINKGYNVTTMPEVFGSTSSTNYYETSLKNDINLELVIIIAVSVVCICCGTLFVLIFVKHKQNKKLEIINDNVIKHCNSELEVTSYTNRQTKGYINTDNGHQNIVDDDDDECDCDDMYLSQSMHITDGNTPHTPNHQPTKIKTDQGDV